MRIKGNDHQTWNDQIHADAKAEMDKRLFTLFWCACLTDDVKGDCKPWIKTGQEAGRIWVWTQLWPCPVSGPRDSVSVTYWPRLSLSFFFFRTYFGFSKISTHNLKSLTCSSSSWHLGPRVSDVMSTEATFNWHRINRDNLTYPSPRFLDLWNGRRGWSAELSFSLPIGWKPDYAFHTKGVKDCCVYYCLC